jgi:DNA-binding winged helix-turn-helix (wHTH) protein
LRGSADLPARNIRGYNSGVPREQTFAFGPYEFDPTRRRLTIDGEPVGLPDRHVDILHMLVSRAGHIVPKDTLIESAWKDVAVSDNSLEQAMSALRRRLGPAPDGSPYIETLARRGYRFRAEVTSTPARRSDDALAGLLVPYRIFLEGRAAVETLERDAVRRARTAFERVVAVAPDDPSGHIGLANALVLEFEGTRATDTPDLEALETAARHAREACRLAADSGEAWATLAFVLSRTGGTDAIAAGRRATSLEPDNWRHHLRLAYAAWGEERLRAARHATRLLPELGLAHWLAATVYVARQGFDEAVRELVAGTQAQDRQHAGERFQSVGLHLLLGLVHLAQGDTLAAEHELTRELAFESVGHIYSRQACAAAWSALGAIRLHESRTLEAVASFREALNRVPGQLSALAALSVIADRGQRAACRAGLDRRIAGFEAHGALVEAAMALSIVDVLEERPAEAAGSLLAALSTIGGVASAGWTVPVEPLLKVSQNPAMWAEVLSVIRSRAA